MTDVISKEKFNAAIDAISDERIAETASVFLRILDRLDKYAD